VAPSTEATDRGRKLQAFARFGVPEYWIVDPDAPAIEILKLAGSDYVLDSKVTAGEAVKSAQLPELTFKLNAIVPRG
jgi:Uma2 family endonuclease